MRTISLNEIEDQYKSAGKAILCASRADMPIRLIYIKEDQAVEELLEENGVDPKDYDRDGGHIYVGMASGCEFCITEEVTLLRK